MEIKPTLHLSPDSPLTKYVRNLRISQEIHALETQLLTVLPLWLGPGTGFQAKLRAGEPPGGGGVAKWPWQIQESVSHRDMLRI